MYFLSPFTFHPSPSRRGLTSVTVLLLMVTLATVAQVMVSMASSGHQSYSAHLESLQSFYVAEAGLEWVTKAVTFVSGSESIKSKRRISFKVTNNTGANITVTGLTASWEFGSPPPADTTQFYEQVRVDKGSFHDDTVWNYTLVGSNRAGNGEAVAFNTGPTVTLANGTQYEFTLYEFKLDETGSSSNGDMTGTTLRVAFAFTPNSFSIGRGTFTLSVPTVTAGTNALYVSTATAGLASRKLQKAAMVKFGPM